MATTKRIVVDTNLLVSRLLLPDSVPGQAVRKAERRGVVLASRATLDELSDVLSRRKLDRYVSVKQRREYLRRLLGTVEMVTVRHVVRASRDAGDDRFLELALSGAADLILTGDADLLVLNPFRGIAIRTASDYLLAD
ncbi:MAG: putative toxin-antitoxin system toxin component, PIN family [Acidobacteria bacterium]|nr:putative toxin-antitoxin system toxin component, PIN family [Acidobacteriota bacterium]MCY4134732.1 putative toxin-antitoxin system toxin component, PIN family [bacterium]